LKKRNGSLSPTGLPPALASSAQGLVQSLIFLEDTLTRPEVNATTPSQLAQMTVWPPSSPSNTTIASPPHVGQLNL
jgi:hypothetical protein